MMDQGEEAAKKMEPEQISGRVQERIPDPEGKGGEGADRANVSEEDTQRSELKVKINANNNAGENSSDHVVQSPLDSGRSKKSVRWSEELVTESPSTRTMASDALTGGSNPYVSSSPTPSNSSTFKDSMHSVRDVLGRWGKKVGEAARKAEDLSKNTWQHLKTAPSFSDAALGRIAQGTKVLAEGGYEKIFRQTFETVTEEQLKDSFACYLSTSAGPVMGVLYISTAKLAFCSDNPLSYKSGEKTEWSYYKFKSDRFRRSTFGCPYCYKRNEVLVHQKNLLQTQCGKNIKYSPSNVQTLPLRTRHSKEEGIFACRSRSYICGLP